MTKAWRHIATEIIRKSFVSCGITAACDGSEDASIVCLRPNEMLAARERLAEESAGDAGGVDVFQAGDKLEDDENEGAVGFIMKWWPITQRGGKQCRQILLKATTAV